VGGWVFAIEITNYFFALEELPEDWNEVCDMAQLRSLDRSFIFPGTLKTLNHYSLVNIIMDVCMLVSAAFTLFMKLYSRMNFYSVIASLASLPPPPPHTHTPSPQKNKKKSYKQGTINNNSH
jgi:hypothetical protein